MMDPETAKFLFNEGATLLFFDVPVGTEFGIDYNSWSVGPKFHGVKLIPPGIHFIYYSACNSEGALAPRTGFFHNFKQKEILVKKWDQQTEDIKDDRVSEDEILNLKLHKHELDPSLGPYPYENYKKWISLTDHVTPNLLDSLQPINGKIASVTEFMSESSDTKSQREASERRMEVNITSEKAATEEERLPTLNIKCESQMRFSSIPKQKYPPGSSPSEISRYSIDSSYALKQIIEKHYSTHSIGILGEIQFAFVCFIIGQVYDAFDQWKSLVHLLCSSGEAIVSRNDLYQQFITMMHFQVREIPEDFFVDIVTANNFLTSTLQEFFSNLDNDEVKNSLRRKGKSFRENLTQKFKWDFTTEPDEFAPVIVDLNL